MLCAAVCPSLALHSHMYVGVFLRETRWQSVASAVSPCDGYDEGQGALGLTLKLCSCSVQTYKHSFLHTHTLTHTHTHVVTLFFKRLTCSRWLQHSEEMHKRNTRLITHPFDNNHTRARSNTLTNTSYLMCLHTALSLTHTSAPKTQQHGWQCATR